MQGIRINIADNGYVLEYDDPVVRERNRTEDGWQDPTRQRVFNDVAQLTGALNTLLPALLEECKKSKDPSDYKSAIAEAFEEVDND